MFFSFSDLVRPFFFPFSTLFQSFRWIPSFVSNTFSFIVLSFCPFSCFFPSCFLLLWSGEAFNASPVTRFPAFSHLVSIPISLPSLHNFQFIYLIVSLPRNPILFFLLSPVWPLFLPLTSLSLLFFCCVGRVEALLILASVLRFKLGERDEGRASVTAGLTLLLFRKAHAITCERLRGRVFVDTATQKSPARLALESNAHNRCSFSVFSPVVLLILSAEQVPQRCALSTATTNLMLMLLFVLRAFARVDVNERKPIFWGGRAVSGDEKHAHKRTLFWERELGLLDTLLNFSSFQRVAKKCFRVFFFFKRMLGRRDTHSSREIHTRESWETNMGAWVIPSQRTKPVKLERATPRRKEGIMLTHLSAERSEMRCWRASSTARFPGPSNWTVDGSTNERDHLFCDGI